MTDPIDLTIDPLQIPTEKLAEGLKIVNDSDVASSEDQNSGPSNPPAPAILWTSSLDFKYKSPSPLHLPLPSDSGWSPQQGGRLNPKPSLPPPLCYTCFKPSPPLQCSRCKVASYCSKPCQLKDWKCKLGSGYHKLNCSQMKLLTRSGTFPSELHRRTAVESGLLKKVKMYLCPFAVHHHSLKGPGFVFLQSPNTLVQLSMPGNGLRDCLGGTRPERMESRQVLMTYLPLKDFHTLTTDDFEMSQIQPSLTSTCSSIDPSTEIVILIRVRCGFVGVCKMKIVLGYAVCMKLGEDYEGKEQIQLNIDDL
ncbi:hypothetical protein TrST_g9910 [Triparma strigata]|uniref:MYND-type domain-containing protein n=1 Tax=Triparma strigata TaxID=1606541 RepID=A0A9W7A3X5_9STRA|nr:hypothetical protein TrST_g9910 [Triparma strigata]